MNARIGRRSLQRIEPLLGPVAAVLLGAAAGFFCLAMPLALLRGLIDPAIMGGRLPLALLVALVVGFATWGVFVWLDRHARPRLRYLGPSEKAANDPPVLRRADAHPDAPARRPIFAGSDLGTPLHLIDPESADWQVEATASDPQPQPQPEEVMTDAPAEQVEETTAEPVEAAIAPDPAPAAMFPPPRAVTAPLRAVAPAPAEPLPSLAAMIARLEAGLARKALVLAGAEPNVTALRREIRPIGGTLSDAVEELHQRTAGRG